MCLNINQKIIENKINIDLSIYPFDLVNYLNLIANKPKLIQLSLINDYYVNKYNVPPPIKSSFSPLLH